MNERKGEYRNWERSSPRYRAALYIRLSREDGDKEESDSVLNQKKILYEYLSGQNTMILYDFYIDDGYTGTNFDRPGFRRMMKDIEEGTVNCVIVKDLSRFGRDYIDTGRYLERIFPEKAVRFISLTDGIDSVRQTYDLLLPIKNIFNEQYARDISGKIQATICTKQRQGEFIGAFSCYGYKKSSGNKSRLIVDEYAAEIVRKIFRLYVEGMTKGEIARALNVEGIPCPTEYKRLNGEKYRNSNYIQTSGWTYSGIHRILHNEMYTGTMVQRKKHKQLWGKQHAVPRDEWIRVPDTHEAIIERKLWIKAQRLLREKSREPSKGTRKNIFSGLVKCGDCKRSMILNRWEHVDGSWAEKLYCSTYKRKGGTYCSPHTVPLGVLTEIIIEDMELLIEKFEAISGNGKKEADCPAAKGKRDRIFEREIKTAEGELERISGLSQCAYEDYREGLLCREEYLAFQSEYRRKKEFYTCRLDFFRKKKAEKEDGTAQGKYKENHMISLEKNRISGHLCNKLNREILVEMVDKIEIYEKNSIKIYYRFTVDDRILFPENYIHKTE